MENLGYL